MTCCARPTAARRGRRCTSRPSNGKPARLDPQVDFLDAKNGYFLAQGGALWRTANAGQVVELAARHRHGKAYGIAFSSKTRGYLVIDRFGDVSQPLGLPAQDDRQRRARGTRSSWSPRRSWAPGSPPRARTDYLLGGQSSFLFTTTGGDAGKASTLSVTTKHKKLSKPAGITVTGKLSPAAGNERVTVSYLPPGLGALAAPDGQDRGQRLLHDELARAEGQQPLRGPVGGRLPLQGRRLRAC